ncbi:MAG TPA: isopentenyl-diphosphate Delta-isomerase [Cyclobacteriaceae bacterium]|nr:isopentenyl-diphosphate Delta-isomerase [Cyclobacteriaceae bacterium]
MEKVILVDIEDKEIGAMEKMEAHKRGLLHRAFSVLLFNSKGELLIQKRAASKYHSAGLWTNTCCSHPLPGEKIEDATQRKLKQEMGIDIQPEFAYKFIYRAAFENGLVEYEFDHVFTGTFDGQPVINRDEVGDWKFISMNDLLEEIETHPDDFTHWFKLIVNHPTFREITA